MITSVTGRGNSKIAFNSPIKAIEFSGLPNTFLKAKSTYALIPSGITLELRTDLELSLQTTIDSTQHTNDAANNEGKRLPKSRNHAAFDLDRIMNSG